MAKRKHQLEFESVIDDIINGSRVRTIVVHVTTGGGKSSLPIVATRLIDSGLADAISWIVPRKSLQDQGERNFMDKFFRDMFGHKRLIRSSTNEDNPCRGLSGFATTYQAIAQDEGKTVLMDFIRKRHILFLDEFHHAEEGGEWHESLKPLVARAEFLVLMTGTLNRGDGSRIAFLPYGHVAASEAEGSTVSINFEGGISTYSETGERPGVMTMDSGTLSIIRYTRRDALNEQAVIPLKFYLSDGRANWIDKRNNNQSEALSSAPAKIVGQAIYTALATEFSLSLLEKALSHWMEVKQKVSGSKMLVVTANYEFAKEMSATLKLLGFNSEIATSHQPDAAETAIKRYKEGRIDILVTIAMAYEGLDVPEITHIACLTNIRSGPWIEQMFGRAVRVDERAGPYESQVAHVFAPDDALMGEIIEKIEIEQSRVFIRGASFKQKEIFSGGDMGSSGPEIKPLSSHLDGCREILLGHHIAPLPATPTETANSLREEIERHTRVHAARTGRRPQNINGKIKKAFGKARGDMTIPELRKALEYVRKKWPLDYGGRGRVPTKVVRYYGGM